MTLIVENGTNVPNANSYLSLVDIRAYCTNRGVTLPVDALLEPMVFKAMDYIESFGTDYQGMITYPTQALQFPRAEILYADYFQGAVSSSYGIMINCSRIVNNIIPKALKDLLCQCVLAVNAGVDFANLIQTQKFTTKEKVGPLEVTYSDKYGIAGVPDIDSIDTYLDTLMYPCGNDGAYLRTVKA